MNSKTGSTSVDLDEQRNLRARSRYWRANLSWMVALLLAWLLVGPVLSILLVETLNSLKFFGFPLGFWFAQQGSILGFVTIIAVYALVMNRLDARFAEASSPSKGGP